jgi:hypothetical protein
MEYLRAPEFYRRGAQSYQAYVEGDPKASASDRETLEYAFSAFGHLVGRGERMTGAQWVRAIGQQYDVSQPRTRAVVDAINRVMLTDKFSDDHILFNPSAQPVFRGTEAQCTATRNAMRAAGQDTGWAVQRVGEAKPEHVEAAELSMLASQLAGTGKIVDTREHTGEVRALKESPWRLPSHLRVEPGKPATAAELWNSVDRSARVVLLVEAGVGIAVAEQLSRFADFPSERIAPAASARMDANLATGGLLQRHMDLLSARPVGLESFTAEQNADLEAQVLLMEALVGSQGYSALAAQVPEGMRPAAAELKPRKAGPLTAEDIYVSLVEFAGGLGEQGWEPTNKQFVFLVRPAPLINPFASIRQFESLVHETLIGWRLPQALVRHAIAEHRPEVTSEPERQRA